VRLVPELLVQRDNRPGGIPMDAPKPLHDIVWQRYR
jgi:hypothetical protein